MSHASQFIQDHVVGRQAASNARQLLALAEQEQLKSKLKQPDTARSSSQKAVARLSSAQKAYVYYGNELQTAQDELNTLSTDADELRVKLATLKRLLSSLKALQETQMARNQRLQTLVRMMDETARERCERNSDQPTQARQRPQLLNTREIKTHNPTPQLPLPPVRLSATRDALANLHAYHISVSRPLKDSTILVRLRRAISKALQKDPSHPDVQATLQKCILLARGRLLTQNTPPTSARSDLNEKLLSHNTHATELQALISRASALGILHAGLLARIKEFEETHRTQTLAHSTREAHTQTHRHMDRLMRPIADELDAMNVRRRRGENNKTKTFKDRVRDACALPADTSTLGILSDVRRTLKQGHQGRGLEEKVPIPISPDTARIAEYQTNMDVAHDRAAKLVARKADKAESGVALADEAKKMLQDCKHVLGIARER
ncbi:hypothetical protein HMN09_00541300 [Mycena chlorophos]|uniref:Uncharacterized protein n=1 Tax=Mycena chlorophos TaxID=658473 RepID=A0A8H6TA04_MYCCL|nr:hypothetical protein HMN09_00541300 [Mycena chlorophos]